MRRHPFLVTLALLLVTAPSAHAHQVVRHAGGGLDFWKGVGRVGSMSDAKPIDLSGDWKVEGVSPDSSTYAGSIEIKRTRTLTTPQGAKFNAYECTWKIGSRTTRGIGMWLGNRLYVGYGSEHLMVGVAAPFELADEEKPAYDRYTKLAKSIEGKETRFSIKNPPWFADYCNTVLGATGYPDPAYYMLWVNAKGGYGDKFIEQSDGDTLEWDSWGYFAHGRWRKDNGSIDLSGSEMPLHWHVRGMGRNFNVHCRDTDKYSKDVTKDSDVDGTSFELEDGTVVMILGGNDDCGFGWYEPVAGKLVGEYAGQFKPERGRETLTPGDKNAALLSK